MTTASPVAGRPSALALAGWMVFVALLLYLVMFGGGYGGIQAVGLRVLSLGIIVAALLIWALLAWREPRWRPSTAIWPVFVIPLASLILSTTLSSWPRLGIEYVAWSVLLIALYLLLARILSFGFTQVRIGGVAALLGGVIGLFYIGLVVGRWMDWWELLGRFAVPPLRPGYAGLPFGGPNHVATVTLLLTAIAFAGLGLRTRGRRIGLTILTVITAVVVVMTSSRSAWLGVAGASVAVLGLWVLLNHRIIASRLGDKRTWVVLAGSAVAGLAAFVVLAPTVLDRLLHGGDGGRPSYFASATRMFEDAPIIGLGPGTWAPRRIAYLEPGDLDYTVPHAHNVYLQTGAELGMVGILAGIAALAALGWLIYRAVRSGDSVRRGWAWATAFGVIYLGIVSVVDFYSNLPGSLVLLAIPVAVLDATSDRGIGVPAALRPALLGRVSTLVLALGCLLSIGVLVWAESTAMTQARARDAAEEADWAIAATEADAAIAADPSQPAHHLTRALAAMAEGDWQTAIDAYEKSVAVDDLPQAWLGLALASMEAGHPSDVVVSLLERAMRMGYQHPEVAYGAGEVYDRLGLTDEADAAYAQAIAHIPSLAGDPAWFAGGPDAARLERLVAQAATSAGSNAWQVALMAGYTERARELAGGGLAIDVVDAWDGDSEALARVQAAADAAPLDAGLLATAGLLSERAGDLRGADRFRLLASTTTEGPAILGVEIRAAPSCDERPRLAVAADLHGSLAYRRPTPANLMPHGLRCLVLPGRDTP